MLMNNSWDKKYSLLAKEISTWSKDPSTQVGAIAVGKHGQLLAQGYNGFPRYIADIPSRLYDRAEKYKYVVHAEMNCIFNACYNGVSLDDATLYVYGLPVCSECSKGVIQVGFSRVVVYTPELSIEDCAEPWKTSAKLAIEMLNEANVRSEYYDSL